MTVTKTAATGLPANLFCCQVMARVTSQSSRIFCSRVPLPYDMEPKKNHKKRNILHSGITPTNEKQPPPNQLIESSTNEDKQSLHPTRTISLAGYTVLYVSSTNLGRLTPPLYPGTVLVLVAARKNGAPRRLHTRPSLSSQASSDCACVRGRPAPPAGPNR